MICMEYLGIPVYLSTCMLRIYYHRQHSDQPDPGCLSGEQPVYPKYVGPYPMQNSNQSVRTPRWPIV